MKVVMTVATAASLATAGAATADGPMVLSDSQLDRLTAGSAHTPDWTDHNIHDPGIVLVIELAGEGPKQLTILPSPSNAGALGFALPARGQIRRPLD